MGHAFKLAGAVCIAIAVIASIVIMGAEEDSPLQKFAIWVAVGAGMWGGILLLSGWMISGASGI